MSGLYNAFVDMFDTATIASIVAGASALMFATMGETISEKAGVINLSVDGSMMLAALAGFVVAFETDNVWLGFPAAAFRCVTGQPLPYVQPLLVTLGLRSTN